MDFLIQVGVSNTCFALILALSAMLVTKFTERPQLAYLLWLLVFIKLIMPSFLSLPLIPQDGSSIHGIETNTAIAERGVLMEHSEGAI